MQDRLEASAERRVPFLYLSNQAAGGGRQGAAQFGFVERADKRFYERIGDGCGEAVETTSVEGVFSLAQAGQGEDVIADATDPVFGTPGLVALNARPGVQGVMPAQPNDGGSIRQRLRCTF